MPGHVVGSDHSLSEHGSGYLEEPGNVGAGDVVARVTVLLGRLPASVVDVLHDLLELLVGVLEAPSLPARVLLHLRAETATPPALTVLPGPKATLSAPRKACIASGVQGMLAPSPTAMQPFSMSFLASPSSSSFWVAHGRATSQGISQMLPPSS